MGKTYDDGIHDGVLILARAIVGMIETDNIKRRDIEQFCRDAILLNEGRSKDGSPERDRRTV